MRKKTLRLVLVFVLCFCIVITFCSCTKEPQEIPYGVWRSETPELVLDINPEAAPYYSGTLVWDGEKIDIFLTIDMSKGGVLLVQRLNSSGGYSIFGEWPYVVFNGYMELRDDGKLEYTIKDYWAEQTGYKTIVFELIDTYDALESSSVTM